MNNNLEEKEAENRRKIRAYCILAKGEIPKMIDKETFYIPSQTNEETKYKVTHHNIWKCECPDFQKRHLKCKHIQAIEIWLNLRNKINNDNIGLEDELVKQEIHCDKCNSYNITKNGNRKTEQGIRQRYRCKDCGNRFTWELIKQRKVNTKMITLTLDLFFKGLSLRKITDTIYQFYNIKIHHETIRRWINCFMKKMNEYVSTLEPKLSIRWHVDEQMIKTKKDEYLWVWNVLDSESRYLIANNVTKERGIKEAREIFKKAKDNANGKPRFVVTDGLNSYKKAFMKEFWTNKQNCRHIANVSIKGERNNNLIERYHGTYRERDKVMRGLDSIDTSRDMLENYRTYYNFIRPHQALNGLTPAETTNIYNDIKNKWLGLLYASIKK
jgi:transposase-like protein